MARASVLTIIPHPSGSGLLAACRAHTDKLDVPLDTVVPGAPHDLFVILGELRTEGHIINSPAALASNVLVLVQHPIETHLCTPMLQAAYYTFL